MGSKTFKGGAEARTIRKALQNCPNRRLRGSNLREVQSELGLGTMSGATFCATVRGMPDVYLDNDREAGYCMLALRIDDQTVAECRAIKEQTLVGAE